MQRQTAVELLYEALLQRGDHTAVASEVEAAIAEDPLRERLTELARPAKRRKRTTIPGRERALRLREKRLRAARKKLRKKPDPDQT